MLPPGECSTVASLADLKVASPDRDTSRPGSISFSGILPGPTGADTDAYEEENTRTLARRRSSDAAPAAADQTAGLQGGQPELHLDLAHDPSRHVPGRGQ